MRLELAQKFKVEGRHLQPRVMLDAESSDLDILHMSTITDIVITIADKLAKVMKPVAIGNLKHHMIYRYSIGSAVVNASGILLALFKFSAQD